MHNKHSNLIFLIILGILCIIFYLEYNIGIPCIFHKITGLYCPGCGLTRSCTSIVTLNFYQAIRYNMLIVILIPFFTFYIINKFILKDKFKIPNWFIIGILIIVILFGILRNIPMFSYLAPTEVGKYIIYMG